ncbi:exodeoxyribonuclease VII small subunit [Faunimonas sp. B44]|uniref:exodeoxyribonuclease VII small subunit n=1 Tax=Faunimonas sp. B44 TaxID=3461493 RepID=UPI004044B001
MAEANEPDVASLSFEQALAELEKIVGRLERGDVALEESIAIYERGEALRARCDALLRQAEERVEKIRTGPDGAAAGVEPFDEA